MTNTAFDPAELVPVSPLVAATLARLYAAHPELLKLHSVATTFLGLTSRYELALRGRPDLGLVTFDAFEVRRELVYFENTKRPLAADQTLTAVDLAAAARGQIKSMKAREAFDQAVAFLVSCARTAAARLRRGV